VQLLGSGTILREVIAAAELLEKEFGVVADIWSCPSFSELRRDGFDVERWNRLHPMAKDQRKAHVTKCLEDRAGPAIAATDYVREYADQIRAFMPDGKRYVVLGTDGFGRSDTRANLRSFFEVDRHWIAHAAIAALAAEGKMNPEDVARAIKQWKLDPEKPNPTTVPAKAGTQRLPAHSSSRRKPGPILLLCSLSTAKTKWIPAFAGMRRGAFAEMPE
jgi:pyruvate dehydrogenase E1 component